MRIAPAAFLISLRSVYLAYVHQVHIRLRCLYLVCICTFSICLLSACYTNMRTNNGLLKRLSDRGVILVSKDNPYLAGNLFLNSEAEIRPEIEGFLKTRGQPDALEVKHSLLYPLELKLYYIGQQEYYQLEETADAWVIDGPFEIWDDKVQEIKRMLYDDPVQASAAAETDISDNNIKKVTDFQDPDYQTTEEKSFNSVSSDHTPQYTPSDEYSEKSQQPKESYIGTAEPLAERTPKGDLVHYVTYEGETLEIIARWYTRYPENAGKIARMNGIRTLDKLEAGDSIIIPAYMLKNKHQLPGRFIPKVRQSEVW